MSGKESVDNLAHRQSCSLLNDLVVAEPLPRYHCRVATTFPANALIITALNEELQALLAVKAGRVNSWTRVDADPPYHTATFDGSAGLIHVAATCLTKMGGVATAAVASALVDRLRPHCLAMCGVCAGHPDDTDLGDVVIADRVFQHDDGKIEIDGFKGDLWVPAVRNRWLRVAQEMVGPAEGLPGYAEAELGVGEWWFLERLLAKRDPLKSTALRRYFPDPRRAAMLTRLRDELGHISLKAGAFSLTESGRVAIEEHRVIHGTRPTHLPLHIHVGPIASGNAIAADGSIWQRLANEGMRKTLAVEMEAAAIGQVAHDQSLPFAVVKAVMDHADPYKTDRFKSFAANASAEVLCRFLRKVVEPSLVSVNELNGGIPPTHTSSPASHSAGSSVVVVVGEDNYRALVRQSPLTLIVGLQPHAASCRTMLPLLESIAESYRDRLQIGRFDVLQQEALASELMIDSYPTLLLFRQGTLVARAIGKLSRSEIVEFVERYYSPDT